MKYRYHIVLYFFITDENFLHSFNSDSKILKMSEIREQLVLRLQEDKGGFHVKAISQTIND